MLGQWTAGRVEPDEEKPDPESWTPVTVPGRPEAFVDAETVAYRTEFDDPRDDDTARALLELRGLFAHARIWLNDDLVGTHDAYFRPFRHAFEPAATNELVVECRTPQDRFGGVYDTATVPDEACVPGIWWDASVEPRPSTFISRLDVRPRVGRDTAEIDVRAVVNAGEDLDDRLTFTLRPEGDVQRSGMMDRTPVSVAAGEQTVVTHTIDVRDPALWWPRGHGPQHQYSVRAKLGEATESVRTGLCTVDRDENGVLVNGERVSTRGFTLQPATPDDIDLAVEANATIVRFHAHVPPQSVYEAATEAGLLVWQDLPLTGPGRFSVDRGEELARHIVWTCDRHPCLAAFGVHDDPVDLFGSPLGSGFLDRLRLRWRTWRASYDAGPAETVAETLPEDRPVFPVVGSVGIDPDATTLYPGWAFGDVTDLQWALDHYDVGDVIAEFGAGALGSSDPTDSAGFDRRKHARHVPDADDTEASQAYQARVVSHVAEQLRLGDTTLSTVFALRDTGDAGMGVVERDGTTKAAYGAIADAYEPVQAFVATPSPGARTDIVVSNDTGHAVEGQVRWEVGDTDGAADLAVPAHDRETVETITIPGTAQTASLTVAVGDHTVDNDYYF